MGMRFSVPPLPTPIPLENRLAEFGPKSTKQHGQPPPGHRP